MYDSVNQFLIIALVGYIVVTCLYGKLFQRTIAGNIIRALTAMIIVAMYVYAHDPFMKIIGILITEYLAWKLATVCENWHKQDIPKFVPFIDEPEYAGNYAIVNILYGTVTDMWGSASLYSREHQPGSPYKGSWSEYPSHARLRSEITFPTYEDALAVARDYCTFNQPK